MDMERIIQIAASGLLNPLRERRDYGGNQLFKDDKEAFDEDEHTSPTDFVDEDVKRLDGWMIEVKRQADAAVEKLEEMRDNRPEISIGDVMEELDYHFTMIRNYTPTKDAPF